jgi:hypothetical protein
MPSYRESYVFYIDTPDPAVFWSGHGPLLLPADDLIPSPVLIAGAGELVDIPALEQLINGKAQRLDVTLSGVGETTVSLAADESATLPGSVVQIGRIVFDETWQIASVIWEWTGEARGLTVTSQSGGGNRVRSLTLSVVAGDPSRRRPALAYFTDADQRFDFPDDEVFSNVAGITAGTTRRWGPA